MSRGKRIEPGIYRRTEGDYLLRLVSHGHELTRVFDRLEDARRLKRERTLTGKGLALPGPRRTLKAILTAYADELEAEGGSDHERIRRLNARMLDHFGQHKAAPLTEEDLAGFRKWVMSEDTKSGGDLYKRGVRTIRTAHKRAKMPRPDAPPLRVRRKGRRVLPPDQTRAFIQAMPWGSPERAVAEIMILTTSREREVFRLKVDDVEGAVLHIVPRKEGDAREHPITPRLRAVLDSVIPPNAKPGTPIILLNGAPPKNEASFRKRLFKASKTAGIKPPVGGFAWLRNTSLTALVEAGAPIEAVSRMAGHASIRTTEIHYDRAVLWKERIAAAELLAEKLGGAPVESATHGNSTPAPETGQNRPKSGVETGKITDRDG